MVDFDPGAGNTLFSDVYFTINENDKIALMGKNGEGKSTMIKAIMKEIAISGGSVEIGHNAQIGYFAQNQASLLDENGTIFSTIDDIAVGDVRTKIKDILGAFMFHGNDKIIIRALNLLILDEPSNHLDIKTKDIIK